MRMTPGWIKSLLPNQIFVFGSNEAGLHGGGAARLAIAKWGAVYGKAEGLQGQTYAIPTKNGDISKTLSIQVIKVYVDRFIAFARQHPELDFLVTEIGCGLAGLTPGQVAPLFRKAIHLKNVSLPLSFLASLKSIDVKNVRTTIGVVQYDVNLSVNPDAKQYTIRLFVEKLVGGKIAVLYNKVDSKDEAEFRKLSKATRAKLKKFAEEYVISTFKTQYPDG